MIQNIDRQPRKVVRTPPATRPSIDPETPATWLIPSALPRSVAGKTSVSIAALFAQISAAPSPCTRRMRTSKRPSGAMLQSPEPIVKMANPRL